MVIGDTFAWGHMRKTGGDATLTMFQVFPDLINYADPRHREQKHKPFSVHEDAVQGKTLVCNIRRLPSLVLSWSHHKNFWGHKGSPVPMDSPSQMSKSSIADEWLAELTDNGRFKIDRWLRWESLAEDFLGFISELTEVTEEQRKRIFEIGKINALRYDHDIYHWFSKRHLARMYENNPAWGSIEKEVYGEIPVVAVG